MYLAVLENLMGENVLPLNSEVSFAVRISPNFLWSLDGSVLCSAAVKP